MKDKQELLSKIKALMERGEGGEKESATKFYYKLLKKYGIKEEDIIDEKIERYEFHYNSVYERKLIAQIIFSVVDDAKVRVPIDNRRHIVISNMTKSQFIECRSMIDFYVVHLHNALMKATTAFINVEGIFNPNPKPHDNDDDDDEEIDPELLGMIMGMQKHPRYTQIEDKSKFIGNDS